jgi:hypothetical protein
MIPSMPPPDATAAPGFWAICLGIAFIVIWLALHVAWGFVFLVSDVMLEILVLLVKPILFPGLALNPAKNSPPPEMCWRTLAGVIAAGLAGIPAGLAFFWRDHRLALLITFAALFIIGVLLQLKTCWNRLVRIFTPPA